MLRISKVTYNYFSSTYFLIGFAYVFHLNGVFFCREKRLFFFLLKSTLNHWLSSGKKGRQRTWWKWVVVNPFSMKIEFDRKILGLNFFFGFNIKYAWLMYLIKGCRYFEREHMLSNTIKWSVSKMLSSTCLVAKKFRTHWSYQWRISFDIRFNIRPTRKRKFNWMFDSFDIKLHKMSISKLHVNHESKVLCLQLI